jgi:hypothetical protein
MSAGDSSTRALERDTSALLGSPSPFELTTLTSSMLLAADWTGLDKQLLLFVRWLETGLRR